jgi:hypothetical protein
MRYNELKLRCLAIFEQNGPLNQHRRRLLASMQIASYNSHSASFGPSAIRVNGERSLLGLL